MSSAASTQLVRYDAMILAIRQCHQVDEVKDIRDKALALQAYHQQANNIEAERLAIEIRIRAERKAGELLSVMKESGERQRGGNPQLSSDTTVASLEDLGITRDQSSKWQQLADIPEHEFESAIKDPDTKPSTAGILRNGTPRTILTSLSDEWNGRGGKKKSGINVTQASWWCIWFTPESFIGVTPSCLKEFAKEKGKRVTGGDNGNVGRLIKLSEFVEWLRTKWRHPGQ